MTLPVPTLTLARHFLVLGSNCAFALSQNDIVLAAELFAVALGIDNETERCVVARLIDGVAIVKHC
jgi:hypothetical protein